MEKKLEQIYHDICVGYSNHIWNNSRIYVKHFSTLDLVEIDYIYSEILNSAKTRGIKTYQDKLEWLIKVGYWSNEKEIELNRQKDYVDTLNKTYQTLIFKSQKIDQKKLIDEETIKLDKLESEKFSLVGLTAENIADKKIQYHYIQKSFYKDKNLEEPIFSIISIDDLDEDESLNLLRFYSQELNNFNIKNVKKIAISPFFTNNFNICGENIYFFFQRPIYKLSNYQISLISYGKYFFNILSNNPNLPENVKNNPEAIEEFIGKQQNLKGMLNKIDSTAQSVGIVANKADFEELGLVRDANIMNSKGPQMAK